MSKLNLWNEYNNWIKNCHFVDLSHEVSKETPLWSGFSPIEAKVKYDYNDGFLVHEFSSLVSQYGTHVDVPNHFVKGKRCLEEITPDELILPLCVIDFRKKAEENPDYAFTKQDILDWEEKYGKIPENAFVAACTNWYKKEDMDNCDENGNKHYPGWSMEALKFLVEERNVHAIGHETADTDASAESTEHGFICEYYILDQNRYQIELMRNLEQVPPTGSLIFCGFPKVKDATGFTARCIAICPND